MAKLSYASDCEPNNLGGRACANDDGTTSDSIPNYANNLAAYLHFLNIKTCSTISKFDKLGFFLQKPVASSFLIYLLQVNKM
ncbi:TPA: hypothetical protein ACPYUI_000234 [Raoultella ornithinolytica]|nr:MULTISPECIES: hypothetical protein [Raoultella]HDX8328672.1 hypothetical protein [Raoultella ornithinolytica CD1_MRS_4]EKR9385324.1 hypothetical protein [Raoultella ornithinolytica]EKV6724477.1 hypothetical protein [Raoultella ornithinolytica]MCT8172665.1 hypothetical protein [Raoultella ornithinolytica]MDH7611686.1 hypothetical protein [Raoultella ornithinolytica]